jgi:DNA repair protein SbcD/Mre11
VRLIHTSDWHLGRSLHGESLLPYQEAFLGWLLEQAVSHGAQAVLVAGDVYDRAVPPADAVALLDQTLVAFAGAGIPVILTSGNHDSAIRLGFAGRLSEAAGVHLRTQVADIARPVLLRDQHGEVAVYGIPYLLPDAVMADLDAERSHAAVLAAAAARIRADAAARGVTRTVVLAHAFVTGGQACDSERDLRVGGIGDAPVSVLAGFSYLALGHLHGRQAIPAGEGTVAGYCGSPLAFSFSERDHVKSVTLADVDAAGRVVTEYLPVPVPRPLREVRGRLDDLLARAGGDLAGLAGAWVKAVLTDQARPAAPMERLREKWPYTLVLDFAPEGGLTGPEADLRRLAQVSDPVEVCGLFTEYAGGAPPDEAQRAVLRAAVEAAQRAAAGEPAAAGPAGVPPPRQPTLTGADA